MDNYSNLLMDLVTKPNVAKSTSTTTATPPQQGLDLSSLLMMLMFSGVFDKDKNKNNEELTGIGPYGALLGDPSFGTAFPSGGTPPSQSDGGKTELGLGGLPANFSVADFLKLFIPQMG